MIKRVILSALETHLAEPEMTVLIGPRQVGKTYLMKLLQNSLEVKGEKTVFLNLDVEEQRQLCVSQTVLKNYLRLQVGMARAFVFIDEIQRKKNAGLFLKGIYDMGLPYKFIVSGSGSLDLKARVKESLAGRKRLFMIEPVSFAEFVDYATEYRYTDRLDEFFAIETTKTRGFLEEYMMFGGYPRVVSAQTVDEKKSLMGEIYQSYLERDIADLLGVEKPGAFSNLVKIMAAQIGSLVNISELASSVGIAGQTIQHYLWYLEETFIIRKVTPFFRNVRSEISKAPVYYFYDLGMRNYLLGLFGLPGLPRALSGHLFENLVFQALAREIRPGPATVHFWRSRDKAEVDFVISRGLAVTPVEVKYTVLTAPKISRSFRSFLDKYTPGEAYIAHLGEEMTDKINETRVRFLPFYRVAAAGK